MLRDEPRVLSPLLQKIRVSMGLPENFFKRVCLEFDRFARGGCLYGLNGCFGIQLSNDRKFEKTFSV